MKYNFIIRGTIGDSWFGTDVERVCDFLDSNKDKEVEIAICSPGGYVSDGLEIYHAIRQHGKVNVTLIGMTASIATVLAMGAAKVRMVKQALILIHNSSTRVTEWSSCNKEKLDSIIQKLNKERADLDTIDKLIASIYSDRCGKPEKDIAELMTKAAWINAGEALSLGLVDEIVDTPEAKSASAEISNHYSNYITQYGLPALPDSGTETSGALASVVDEKGNPAESFLQKTVQKIQGMLHINNNTADNNVSMNNTFKLILACLAVDALPTDKSGNISLSEQQAKALEDRLAALQAELDAANTDKDKAEKTAEDLQKTIKQKDSEIENLKKTAPADDETPAGQSSDVLPNNTLANEMFNAVKNL